MSACYKLRTYTHAHAVGIAVGNFATGQVLAKKGAEEVSSVTLTIPTKDPINWPLT